MKFIPRRPRDGINLSDTHPLVEASTLFVGLSAGAAAVAAIGVAEEIAAQGERGLVTTVFPDAGYKYLTSNVWEAK